MLSSNLPGFGYAVDVGANDGVFNSNSKHFEDRGWIVLCVEPNPKLETIGRSNRKLWRPVACGRSCVDLVDFWIVGEYPYASFSGMHINEYPPAKDRVIEGERVKVKMETLNLLLEHSGFPRLDLLTIDAEGHELEILLGIDLERWRPKVIVAESWTSDRCDEIAEYLKPFTYSLDAKKLYDCCYVRKVL